MGIRSMGAYKDVVVAPANQACKSDLPVFVCMYVCMYVCMCMYVCVCMYVCMYACMHGCMDACMHVCMYVCMDWSISIRRPPDM
jgi:hypothetical protein